MIPESAEEKLAQQTAEELRYCVDNFGEDGWGFTVAAAKDHLLRAFRSHTDAAVRIAVGKWAQYSQHRDSCAAPVAGPNACNCGLTQLRRDWARQLAAAKDEGDTLCPDAKSVKA